MKNEKGAGKSRNARLNLAKEHVRVMAVNLAKYDAVPFHDLIEDTEFWSNLRSSAETILQSVHEASAYNNCLQDDI